MKKIDLYINTAYILQEAGNIRNMTAYINILQAYRKNMTISQLFYYCDLKICLAGMKAKSRLKAFF